MAFFANRYERKSSPMDSPTKQAYMLNGMAGSKSNNMGQMLDERLQGHTTYLGSTSNVQKIESKSRDFIAKNTYPSDHQQQ